MLDSLGERDFYRYAESKLRDAFPTLPDRSQFNRLVRSCTETHREDCALHLAAGSCKMLDASLPTKLSTPRRCPSGTLNAGDMDGLPDEPTSVGLIAWAG